MSRRDVVSQDPSLSQSANAMLTRELRSVVGSDFVDIEGDDPAQRHVTHARRSPRIAALYELRIQFVLGGLAIAVTVVLALAAQGSAWLVLIPLAGLVGGLLVVMRTIAQVTSETEHVSPGLAALLESEGIADPDELFTELLADFTPLGANRRPAAMVRDGQNVRTSEADDDPAGAAQEQRTALTPTSHKSPPAGAGTGDEDKA